MRTYIINTDNVFVSREAPLQPDENEIIVASLEELRAARLSGKRLLALWNGLPGTERLTKIGNREALVERLWSALEALPDPQPARASKQAEVSCAARRPGPVGSDVAAGEKSLPRKSRGSGWTGRRRLTTKTAS